MAGLYAESSAVLRWLLGHTDAPTIATALGEASEVVTSTLTPVEVSRTLQRLAITGQLTPAQRGAAWRVFTGATKHWRIHAVTDDLLRRAATHFRLNPSEHWTPSTWQPCSPTSRRWPPSTFCPPMIASGRTPLHWVCPSSLERDALKEWRLARRPASEAGGSGFESRRAHGFNVVESLGSAGRWAIRAISPPPTVFLPVMQGRAGDRGAIV